MSPAICRRRRAGLAAGCALAVLIGSPEPAPAQFDLSQLPTVQHLLEFPVRPVLGDPAQHAALGHEGPKGIAVLDCNGDGLPDLAISNLDGTVDLLVNEGGGDLQLETHLQTGTSSLREIIAHDLDGDGQVDLAVAAPYEGVIIRFWNEGDSTFSQADPLAAWPGVRNLAAGDFDGDGLVDLAAAGPGAGVRHYRGTSEGAFEILGDLPALSPTSVLFPKPVFALHTVRSLDGLRDELLVATAETENFVLLATADPDRSSHVDPALQSPPQDGNGPLGSPVVITEFMADNTRTFASQSGEYADWIELFNRSPEAVSLAGYFLTDKQDNFSKWALPAVALQPGEFLVIFASENENPPVGEHHANFKLAAGGEYLALTNGAQVVHSFPVFDQEDSGATFPNQAPDVSYGLDQAGQHRFFLEPSPGWANNAGVASLKSADLVALESLITETGGPGAAAVTVTAVLRNGERVNTVWLTAQKDSDQSSFTVLMQASGSEGSQQFAVQLPAGSVSEETRLEVHARREDGRVQALRARDTWMNPQPGALRVVSTLNGAPARSLDVARLMSRNDDTDAPPDLVTAERDANRVVIRRGLTTYQRFSHAPAQVLTVPGGPRAVRIADMDGDGWNDLVVVQRNADKVVTYRNHGGSFSDPDGPDEQPALPFASVSVGRSPREVVLEDFTGDGKPDAAVINRLSNDLSILQAVPDQVAFRRLDLVYEQEGLLSGLLVRDVNRDGRDDVILVYRGSGEISVQLTGEDGSLEPPWLIPLDELPGGIEFEDCNGDGQGDFIIPDLENEGGLVLVLSGPDGGYLDPVRFDVVPGNPESPDGLHHGLLTVSMADFDGDGDLDAVASIFDCRVAFYEGRLTPGAGDEPNRYDLTLTGVHDLTWEFRRIVPEDFDGDGDLDFATVGWQGDVVTVENPGDLDGDGRGDLLHLADLQPWKRILPPRAGSLLGAEEIRAEDLDGDGELDLLVGSPGGTFLYRGGPGMAFERPSEPIDGAEEPASGMTALDFDGDGRRETLAVGCEERACLTFIRQDDTGVIRGALTVQVPAARYLATGDLDGDGKPDLVGADQGLLWTGLSSRGPKPTDEPPSHPGRAFARGVLLNELLSRNTEVPLLADGGKTADFLELFNNTGTSHDLEGHSLVLRTPGADGAADVERSLVFPPLSVIQPGGHLLVVFSESVRSPLHTGFRLPGEGGELTLFSQQGTEIDRVRYPAQRQDIAYSRFFDGSPRWTFNQVPTPGSPNVDGGLIKPVIRFLDFDPASLRPGKPIPFRVSAGDDYGVVGVRLVWSRLDQPGLQGGLVLFDDGKHGDGAMLDGVFGNTLEPGLPDGASLAFYLEAVDLTGRAATDPDDAGFEDDDDSSAFHTLGVRESGDLILTEAVIDNATLTHDERGGTPGYVEITNVSSHPVDLGRYLLTQNLDAPLDETFLFPLGHFLAPGQAILVYLDSEPRQGPLHAPFRLTAGEHLILLTTGPDGGRFVADAVSVPSLAEDQAWSRSGEVWEKASGSPLEPNPISWNPRMAFTASGDRIFTAVFPTRSGQLYLAESSADLRTWTPLGQGSITGTGLPFTQSLPLGQSGYLRLRELPGSIPEIDLALGAVTRTTVEVRGTLEHGAQEQPQVTLFWDTADRGTLPAAWAESFILERSSGAYAGLASGLTPGNSYVFRARAATSAGSAWSEPHVAVTLSEAFPQLALPSAENITTRTADLVFPLEDAGHSPPALTLFWGAANGGVDPDAWDHSLPLPSPEEGASLTHSLDGLSSGSAVFFRVRALNAAGETWSPSSVSFETLTDLEAMRRWLVISEFMYHPPPPSVEDQEAGFVDEDEFEYVELHNTGPIALDLTDLTITGDIRFSFKEHALVREIPPGGYLLAVRNLTAFTMRYGSSLPIAGQWCTPFACGKLSQQEDEPGLLGLRYRERDQLVAFSFADRDPWPRDADGLGYSVELLDPAGLPSHSDPAAWGASIAYLGSPGNARAFPPGYESLQSLRISEVRVAPGELEFIELCNAGPEPLDLSEVHIGTAVQFAFADGSIHTLAPGAAVLVVRNPEVFERFYGPGLPIAGLFEGSLEASGETIVLSVGAHTFLRLDYGSLTRPGNGGISTDIVTLDDPLGASPVWAPSTLPSGSPGVAIPDSVPSHEEALRPYRESLRITEYRLSPHDLAFIELTNFGNEALHLGFATIQLFDSLFSSVPGNFIFFLYSWETLLGPGESVVLAANGAAFEAHYGTGLPVLQKRERFFGNQWVRMDLVVWGETLQSVHLKHGAEGAFTRTDPFSTVLQIFHASDPPDGTPGAYSDLTYESWTRSFEPPLSPDPAEDSDGDGSSQLLEYACNTDPRRRDAAPLRLETGDGGSLRLVFAFRPEIADIEYSIDRLQPDGSFETILEHVPGEPNPLLSVRAREAAFTLPGPPSDAALYRLRVRLLTLP